MCLSPSTGSVHTGNTVLSGTVPEIWCGRGVLSSFPREAPLATFQYPCPSLFLFAEKNSDILLENVLLYEVMGFLLPRAEIVEGGNSPPVATM